MSKINVNTWEPETGTALTMGASGDTTTVPSGATLDVNGTIDVTGATTTGFPAGGLTEADCWVMTTTFTDDATPIASNWARDTSNGFGLLGTGMTESSGIFTFPSNSI